MPPRLPRPFPSTRIALLSGLAALAPCASAQLAWDTTEISAASPAPNRESELSFSFQNTGRSPLQIESVTHSCNCLRTQLSKHALAPGESGKLTAWVRTVGTPTERTVRLLVTTVQDPLHPVSLKIRLSPAASASVEPAVLWWP
ncbi:MAG: hypothetical protein RLZZ142_503, partial [Verrucomicrobiota bacterium]